jgi:hypothetical protein
MKTIRGLRRVDVIYRRVDDDFLDPLPSARLVARRARLIGAYRAGNVALVNAVGNGVADDKASTPGCRRSSATTSARTRSCRTSTRTSARTEQRSHVLDHLDELVVKPVGESGGYGMLVGPSATAPTIDRFREAIEATRGTTSRSRDRPFAHALLRPGRSSSSAATSTCGRTASTTATRSPSSRRPDPRRDALRLARRQLVAGRRQQGHVGGALMLLSRIAESLFWMARYMERAEDTARILDVNYHMLLEGTREAAGSAGSRSSSSPASASASSGSTRTRRRRACSTSSPSVPTTRARSRSA